MNWLNFYGLSSFQLSTNRPLSFDILFERYRYRLFVIFTHTNPIFEWDIESLMMIRFNVHGTNKWDLLGSTSSTE